MLKLGNLEIFSLGTGGLLSSLLILKAETISFSKAFIYYIPFQFETYEPITAKNIKEKAKYKIEISDKNKISTLCDLTSDGAKTSSFDEKRVRLLIVFGEGKQQIFVDANGNVFAGEKRQTLSPKSFEKLKNVLSELIK